MKLTKTLAALGILGAALLAFASCKDTSGNSTITAAPSAPGVAKKWALSMTVDATGDNIKVGEKAITDSNEMTTGTIVANTEEGKTTAAGHELELQQCGKRAFKEFTGGFNNTEGFRTNVVLDMTNGTWRSTDTKRVATAGILFDFYEYEKVAGTKTYDFFYISFKPMFNNEGTALNGIRCYFERYSGVKKTKEGIYSRHDDASALGSNYIQTVVGTWDKALYTPSQSKTFYKDLTEGSDYYKNADGNIVIGVNAKQKTKGVYTINVGKISYTVNDAAQDFTPSAFKESWRTTFATGTEIGVCGETRAKTGDTGYIKGYTNWTHVDKNDNDSNLKGGVLTYAFAPQGTKPVASFYTCDNKLSSNTTDNDDSRYDYVGDWKVPATVDADGVTGKIFYEEGNVVHEYYYY